jgi:hypothetical protein
MRISAKSARCDDETVWVDLADGRTIGAPIAWFPRLLRAMPEHRAQVRIGATGQVLLGTRSTKTFVLPVSWQDAATKRKRLRRRLKPLQHALRARRLAAGFGVNLDRGAGRARQGLETAFHDMVGVFAVEIFYMQAGAGIHRESVEPFFEQFRIHVAKFWPNQIHPPD